MRKILLTAAMLLTCQFMAAQTVEKIMAQFKNENNITCVNLPKALMDVAKAAADDEETALILDKIDEIHILVVDEASGSTRRKFEKEVEKLNLTGYEEMLRKTEDGEVVKIISKGSGENITELILHVNDEDECALIQIKGNISPDDIQIIVDKGTEMSKKKKKD